MNESVSLQTHIGLRLQLRIGRRESARNWGSQDRTAPFCGDEWSTPLRPLTIVIKYSLAVEWMLLHAIVARDLIQHFIDTGIK